MTITTPRQFLFWSLSGFLFVWGWFRTIFWNLTEIRDSFWEALLDIFLYPSTPEYMLGAGIDQMGTFWIFSSIPSLIASNGYIEGIYFPIGWDIGWNTGFAWADGLFSLPLQWLGIPAFYNIHIVFTLWTSFMGICWLLSKVFHSKSWTMTVVIPIIAIVTLNTPFAFEEIAMGRPTQVYWWPLCLYLGLVFSWKDSSNLQWGKTILIGISFAISCLVYWFGAVAIGMCVGSAMILQTLFQKHRKEHIVRCLIAGGFAIGVIGICTFRMLRDLWTQSNTFEQLNSIPITTVKIGTFSFPIYDQVIIHSSNQWFQILSDHPTSIPILIFGFLGIIIPIGWKSRLPWMFAWILSLGIPITGAFVFYNTTIPTGQTLLQWIFPLLLRCENPERMMVATSLLSLVTGGMAVRSLLINTKTPIWVPISLIILLGTSITWPKSEDLQISSFVVDHFRISVANAHPGGMIDVPLSRSENTYIQQIYHHQPILGGPGLNRVQPIKHKMYCENNRILKGLIELEQTGNTNIEISKSDIQRLIADGFSIIIYDPQGNRVDRNKLDQFIQHPPALIDERTGQTVYSLESMLKDKQ